MIFQGGLLQWVIVENELHHVSEFSHLIPKSRPSASCPVCERPVVMKLGKQKVHHVAHAPESSCLLTNPETALHFNIKMRIARQIQQAEIKELYISQTCSSCYDNEGTVLWTQDWDDVKVERRLENNLQPDIQLLRQGDAIAAIEIFVTHSVDREKAAKLQALCLPWVEIKGKPALYTGHEAWHIDIPLPVFNTNHILDNAWLCEKCFTRKVEMEKRHQWLENNGTKPLEYKLIDFFYPYGRWMRNLFIIECTLENGKQTKFTLTRFTTSLNYDRIKYYEEEEHIVAASSPATDTRAVIKKLKEEGRKFLLKIKKEGVILDSPMPWIEKEPSSFEFYDLRNFPRRYFFNKKTRQWFIPKDRNLVVWFNEQGNLDREITYWHRP